jgi:hypothetical protein
MRAEDCYQDGHARTVCEDGACAFDSSLVDLGSGIGGPCLDRMDCDIVAHPEMVCSLTQGTIARNVCTPSCSGEGGCAVVQTAAGGAWTCYQGNCFRVDCDTSADCSTGQYSSPNYGVCTPAGTCQECASDGDCAGKSFFGIPLTKCDTDAFDGSWTCGECLTDADCSGGSSHCSWMPTDPLRKLCQG